MRVEFDHLFICASPGAPDADELIRFGLREGPPNQHPGQGTANRRFAFVNSMIELLWVSDAGEAQSECTRRTLLWERWSGRQSNACPFGICVRPSDARITEAPFPGWEYRPAYLPDPLSMHVGEAGIEEPMWVYLSFMRRSDRGQHFAEHPNGIREITGLALTTLVPLRSVASQKIMESKIPSSRIGENPLLEIEFDHNRRNLRVDFRPHLPLVFRV